MGIVAVGGGWRVGAMVGSAVGVHVGGSSVGGSLGIGAGVYAGGGPGLGAVMVGEAVGSGVGVALGWEVSVGMGVFVDSAGATLVLVGVGVTAGAPGLQRMVSGAASDSRTKAVNRTGFLVALPAPPCHFVP